MNAAMLRAQALELALKQVTDARNENEHGRAVNNLEVVAEAAIEELRADAARLEAAAPVGEPLRQIADTLQCPEFTDAQALAGALDCISSLRAVDMFIHEVGKKVNLGDNETIHPSLLVRALARERNLAQAAIAVKPAAVPEGWRLVPVDSAVADGMLIRFMHELHAHLPEQQRPHGWADFSDEQRDRIFKGWAAMLSAAPSPDAASGVPVAKVASWHGGRVEWLGDWSKGYIPQGTKLYTHPIPGSGVGSKIKEAIEDIRGGLQFAYENGLHEFGYDPVAVIEAALPTPPKE